MIDAARLLKSKLLWCVAALALLVGLYALLGFYVAPRVVRSQAIAFVHEKYGRELTIGEVRIQPFELQAEVRDVSLPDADGTPMLGFRRLFVDFEASSLWQRAYVFREVTLDAPLVRAVLHPDGSLNLADLALKDDEEDDGAPPLVWIQSFTLGDGTVKLLNQLRRRPIERKLAPVAFTLRDFKTTPEGGNFSLSARSPNDEKFEWKGRFAVEPGIVSSGTFAAHDLRVPGLVEFVQDLVPFDVPRGEIDIDGSYDLDVSEATKVHVALSKVVVTDVALRARGVDDDWIELPSVVVSDTKLGIPEQTITVGDVAIDGLKARAWMEPDGTLNTDRLFKAPTPAAPASPPPADATPAVTPAPAASARDWTVDVASVALRKADVSFEDRTVTPVAKFDLAPLDLTVRQATLDLSKPLPLELDTAINGLARLHGTGQVVPDPFALDVDVDLADFPLLAVQPYANGRTDLTIKGGVASAKGTFALSPAGSGKPELRFTGDAAVAKFASIDNALEQDFVNFDRVELSKLDFALAPDKLSIDRVKVVEPFARVIISSDSVLNVSAVFDPAGTAAAVAASRAEAARKTTESQRKKTRAELKAEKAAAAAAAKQRAAAAQAPAPALKETGMPIRIREVTVTGGTMDFADFSVQPNFAAAVQSLKGKVTGMSSDPNSRATVALEGNVGEFSPVNIEGSLQPFAFDRYTDLGLEFQNISLPIFNPYSGRFAGYNIAKGKLTTDLHYTIVGRKLDAKHHIRIDQLEWGEATAEKGEATLPVKFATSLLKDADGVIELDIPVAGTLDDPTFRVGPIVWHVIKNLITKAVTAPFKALGALFKGAEEAQFVDWAPGSATLDPAAAERFGALGKSLAPKTDLRLEVPIGADAELDGKALAEARYQAELAATIATTVQGRKKPSKPAEGEAVPAVPAFDTLDADKRIDVLTALYEKLAGARPTLPPAPERTEGESRKEARQAADAATIAFLEQECRARATAQPGDLTRLGQQRGEAVQRALLTDTGLAPERVYLARDGKVTANAQQVRFELAVK